MAGVGLGAGWVAGGWDAAGHGGEWGDAEGAALENHLIAFARDAHDLDEPLRAFTAIPLQGRELEQTFCQETIAARQKAVFALRSQSIQRR